MTKTNIEWSDEVWNPVVGCTKASGGCDHCYAKTLHDKRHKAALAGLARAGKLKALAYSNDVPVRRRSERSPSHGNLQQVYIAPRFAA